jgi:exodeoxyribonuclease VII large subunit
MNEEITFSVSEFVDVFNQTIDFAYPSATIVGELANFRISKNKWVYFDLKDENSNLKFFASVYRLPGPLEDGMMLKVKGQPRLHNLYGFSVNVLIIQAAGEGSIRKAAALLEAKLVKEGLFDDSRKRALPYPPERVALITSDQSAAYADFNKILNERWQGVEIDLINVQVQGEIAPSQIVLALEQFNASAVAYDVVVIIRGGGSAEDLAAFNTEQVTRAVAASRIPTLVAIGHEVDVSLAELAADRRASTPSNASELLVPDKRQVKVELKDLKLNTKDRLKNWIDGVKRELVQAKIDAESSVFRALQAAKTGLASQLSLIDAYNPEAVLKRGYAIVRLNNKVVRSANQAKPDNIVDIRLANGELKAKVE